jgi:tetratricopeptide (TPR) repeat protein
MRTLLLSRSTALAATLFAALAAACSAAPPAPAAVTPTAAVAPTPPAEREHLERRVRADFFAGLAGDPAAFARAMKVCDDLLAAHPDDAEALVWRGAGRLWESGLAYRAGDAAKGRAEWDRALAEMDRAVALAPDEIGVRIPRGAAVLGAAPHVPDPRTSRALYERAGADYDVALRHQEPYLGQLSTHAREELFFGLADVEAHLGDTARARQLFERLLRDVPDSSLAPYARAWLAGSQPDSRPPCTGCHSG